MARAGADGPPPGGLVHFFRRLLGGASLLSLSSLLTQGVGFLLLPVYTRYLSPVDYGQIEVLMVSVFLANMIVAQGMPPSLLRQLSFVHGDRRERHPEAAGTALLYVTRSGLMFAVGAAIAAPWAGPWLFGAEGYDYLVRVGGILVAATTFISVGNAVLMANGRVRAVVAIGFVQFGVKLALNILLVVVLEVGFVGIIWSHFVGDIAGVVTTLVLTRSHVRWKFVREEARQLQTYGRPLVAATIGYQVLSLSDRYLIRFLRPPAELGLYAVAHKFSAAFYQVVVWPLSRMWEVNGLELAREQGGARRIARVANLYMVVGGLATMAVVGVTEPLLRFLVPPEYLAAEAAVGILVGAAVFTGLGELFKVGLRVHGSSREIAWITGFAAVLNIVLGLLIIPRWGFAGAAGTSLVSSAVLAWSACWVSSRVHPIPWDVPRLVAGSLLVATVCLVQPAFGVLLPGERLLVRSAMFVAYLVLTPLLIDDETRSFVTDGYERLRARGQAIVGKVTSA